MTTRQPTVPLAPSPMTQVMPGPGGGFAPWQGVQGDSVPLRTAPPQNGSTMSSSCCPTRGRCTSLMVPRPP
jgi:hypothetical protein